MKRYVCFVALLGVVAIPDWASAFFRPWCAPPPCSPYGYGYGRFGGYRGFGGYAMPVPVYSPPVVVQPCVPVYEVPVAPPRVYQVPAAVAVAPIPAVNPVKPPAPPTVAADPKPIPKPAAVKPPEPDPMLRPAGGPTTALPAAAPSPAPAPKPEPETSPLVLPPVPETPNTKPMTPLVPSATPAPAPAPGTGIKEPEPLVPAVKPMPKKPANSDDTLPPLVLPPEGPGGPSGVVPPVGDASTSRSSPLTAGPKVQVFTVSGGPVSGQLRKVGFFNHTDRDIDLVIVGRAVKLPRKTYLHAQLPPTFQWKQGDRKAETATVPESAAGLDVLFRE
jgi:hypothetical protein